MGDSKESVPLDLSTIETIHDLNAARLALRWALERIHALEKTAADAAEKAGREERARQKAEDECRVLGRKVSLALEQSAERGAYYSRMQEFVSLRLSGKPDEKAAAMREIDLTKQQENLQRRRLDLEKEFTAKTAALESEFRQARLALMAELQEQARKHERELAERLAPFEQEQQRGREQLARELASIQKKIDSEVAARVDAEQERLAHQLQLREQIRHRERTALLKDLEEALQRASAAEEAARLAQSGADQQAARHDADKAVWEHEKAVLDAGVVAWRARAQKLAAQASGSAEQAAAAESAALASAQERTVEAKQRALAEERERILRDEMTQALAEWETKQKSFSEAFEARRADIAATEALLTARFAELDKEGLARDEEWRRREEDLSRRSRDWHEELRRWQLMLEDRETRLEELKTELSRAIQRYSRPKPDAPPSTGAGDGD